MWTNNLDGARVYRTAEEAYRKAHSLEERLPDGGNLLVVNCIKGEYVIYHAKLGWLAR